jgi:hypothetical protein
MRTPILRVALVCAALLSPIAHAQEPVYRFHTEGGSSRAQSDYRHLNEVLSQYSQDTPFAEDYSGDISIWCRDIMAILDQSQRRADNLYASDRIIDAARELWLGLRRAQEHLGPGTFGRSITARTVWYGNILAKKLFPVAERASTNMRTFSLFISEYYKLIRTAYEIDTSYSFEYGNCYECRDGRLQEFEQRLVMLAQNELKVVLDGLLVRGGPPIPLGSSDGAMYLTAETLTLSFAADILYASPYRNAYACVIGELLALRDNLANGTYSGPVEAIEESAYETRELIQRMSFHSCWGGGYEPVYPDADGPNGPGRYRHDPDRERRGYDGDDEYGHRGLQTYSSQPRRLSDR